MSNELCRFVVTIEMDRWHPFIRECEKELDDLLLNIKGKKLLGHYGNVRTVVRMETTGGNSSAI